MKYYAKLKKSSESKFDFVDCDTPKNAKEELQARHVGFKIRGLGEYLVEAKMYFYLKDYFPNSAIIYNKPLSVESQLTKNINPDFRIDKLTLKGEETKLIIEYDGYQHYTNALEALKDVEKNKIYEDMGYKIIRLPYFIQIKEEIVNYYFGQNMAYDNSYSHGFIDKNVHVPADYCSLGTKRFIKELEFYHKINSGIVLDIIKTLKNKICEKKRTNNKWEKIIENSVVSDEQIEELKKYGW